MAGYCITLNVPVYVYVDMSGVSEGEERITKVVVDDEAANVLDATSVCDADTMEEVADDGLRQAVIKTAQEGDWPAWQFGQ